MNRGAYKSQRDVAIIARPSGPKILPRFQDLNRPRIASHRIKERQVGLLYSPGRSSRVASSSLEKGPWSLCIAFLE